MPIFTNNPILSSNVFIVIFVFALLISIGRKKDAELFSLALTQEIKGLAILSVIFAHIGYFLSVDHGFLFPLSIISGVGVNLFLFLSGYGLTVSALKEKLSPGKFYKKRLLRLFIPFWLIIITFLVLDFFILHISYGWLYVTQTMLGFFPKADLFIDIDSPAWFLTQILFYYLIFPLFFLKKYPWITAILIYISSYFVIQLNIHVTDSVLSLYKLHLLAFPLGVAFASLFFEQHYLNNLALAKIRSFLSYQVKKSNVFQSRLKTMMCITRYSFLIALLILIGYTAYYSGVGENLWKEQSISLITMSAIIFFFILKKVEIKIFHLFGTYAYEVYLVHWPLASRYDFFFKFLPAWLAMIFYLILVLTLAWLLARIQDQIRQIKITNKLSNITHK